MAIKAGMNSLLRNTAALTAIVSTRVYHRDLPQEPTYPCLVYTQISDVAMEHTHDQYIGPRKARFQIDCYAMTRAAVEDLIEAVYTALAGYQGAMGTYSGCGIFDLGLNPDASFKSEKTLKWVEGRSRDFEVNYHG